MKYCLYLALFLSLGACVTQTRDEPVDPDEIKKEVVAAEKAFEEMAEDQGIAEAFYYFADSSAVILRGNELHAGKDNIRSFCEDNVPDDVILKWTPTFVDVSASGDMAYTYGNYTYTITDSTGNTRSSNGIFHTVWKKQPDGSWRFVWD